MIKTQYPFTAIVGQEQMKKALIFNVINPLLNGVLIKGEKGTAKSTAVRALADLLPLREEVENCRFHCCPSNESLLCSECQQKQNSEKLCSIKGKMKVINLPVSATEDRVVGTLDIERALKSGEKKFEPGILAEANRNILYVDEVNLLDDHVVDVLLDAAAMGVNTIEREGISYSHPARFILVGTMNPEEGDLRPQLLDRFGLVVEVKGEYCPNKRKEIIKRRIQYESNAEHFAKQFIKDQLELSNKIEQAKKLLPQVTYSEEVLELIAKIAIELEVDGHRADITMLKTAITNAAYEGRANVEKEDISEAAKLVLPHRMRRNPFQESVLDIAVVEKIIESNS